MAAIEISDVTSVADTQGEIRLNLGDVASGTGFGSNVTLWGAGDHFIGIPVAATSTQGTQALWTTTGNLRVAIATRDARWQAKQGNLAAGDAAIVSDCDAGLRLTQADNTIALASTQVSVTVDGRSTGKVETKHGSDTLTFDATGLTATVGGFSGGSLAITSSSFVGSVGGPSGASVSMTPVSLALNVGPLSIVMVGAIVNISMPFPAAAILQVNGAPVTVP